MTYSNVLLFEEEYLKFQFTNKEFLKEALTHSSFTKRNIHQVNDNERLEFFGDAVLKLLVSEFLFKKFENYNEGQLTKIRSRIVSDQLLATFAKKIDLGKFIVFSYGEEKTGGAKKLSNLANAFEALLGAIYLDQGYLVVQTFFYDFLHDLDEDYFSDLDLINQKSLLQEYLQAHKLGLPEYLVVDSIGPDHEKLFEIEVSVTIEQTLFKELGKGKSKKEAEQAAAKKLLSLIKKKLKRL